MFSAIFGSFYGRVEDTPATTTEDNTTSSLSTEASTQTFDNKTISTQANLDTSKTTTTNLNDTSSSQQLDWVLVEDEANVNDKACGVVSSDNNVEMSEEAPSLPSMESDDVLIGSFFVKNESDDESVQQQQQLTDDSTDKKLLTENAWFVTPLPCLTKMTASSQLQKSMIDNDQIENLRIEQPDRFMSASTILETTTAKPISRRLSMKGKPTLRYKKTYAEATQQEDVIELKSLFDMSSSQTSVPVMSMELVLVPTIPIPAQAQTPTRNEKRKETMKSLSPATSTSSSLIESPKKMSRKTGKNMKTTNNSKGANKSSSHQPKANKENIKNMQMKTLLLAECFPNENKKKRNNNRYGQMLHANKNSALFAMAGNTRHRKFHNLQQPSITVPHPVKF